MGIGAAVRHRLGKFEVPAANAYRSFSINLDDLAVLVASLFPGARRILEVGCGDGMFASRLEGRFPRATYVGLDIAADPGRLFAGDRERFSFHSLHTRDYLQKDPEPFDLVLLVDVMHHVPDAERDELFADLRAMTAPGGHYVIKDWTPSRAPVHYVVFAADRFISGGPVSFLSADDIKLRLGALFPDDALAAEARVPPRRNNLMLAYRRR
jgi:SAM-dependent methyltransferase